MKRSFLFLSTVVLIAVFFNLNLLSFERGAANLTLTALARSSSEAENADVNSSSFWQQVGSVLNSINTAAHNVSNALNLTGKAVDTVTDNPDGSKSTMKNPCDGSLALCSGPGSALNTLGQVGAIVLGWNTLFN